MCGLILAVVEFVISRNSRQEQMLNIIKSMLVLELLAVQIRRGDDYSCSAREKGELERLCGEIQRTGENAIRRGNITKNRENWKDVVDCFTELGRNLCDYRPFAHKGRELLSVVLELVDGSPPTMFKEHRRMALATLAESSLRGGGEHEQALDLYRKLLALEGQPLWAYASCAYQVGTILIIQGELSKAKEFLVRMLRQVRLKEQETQEDPGVKSSKREPTTAREEIEKLSVLLNAVYYLIENKDAMKLSLPDGARDPDAVLTPEKKKDLESLRSKTMKYSETIEAQLKSHRVAQEFA